MSHGSSRGASRWKTSPWRAMSTRWRARPAWGVRSSSCRNVLSAGIQTARQKGNGEMRKSNLAWLLRLAHRPGRVAFAPLTGFALLVAACAGIVQPGQWSALSRTDEHVVLSLADDPFDPNIVYAGTAGGRVYRAPAPHGSGGPPG